MNWKIFDCPLGVCVNEYSPRKKEWIGAAVSAAVAIGSAIFGGAKSRRERKRAEQAQRDKEAKEDAWYARRYNESYADTAAGQRLLTQAREYADSNWRKAQGAARVAGDTDAAVAAAKEQGNKVVSDTLGNMAAADTQRRDNVDTLHMQNQQKFGDQRVAMHQQHAAEIANTASAVSNAAMQAGNAVDSYSAAKAGSGALSNVTGGGDVTGGGNNGTSNAVDTPIYMKNPWELENEVDYA